MNNKISNIIYWILLIFIIFIAGIPIISTIQTPIPFRMYAVQTGSMEPAIKVGDLIFVKEEKEYSQGDVITFRSGSGNSQRIVTHRIANVNEDKTYTTKGDANSGADVDRVSKENIIGKYFFRIPIIGYPINFSKTPLGFLGLIAVPAIVIGYEEVNNIREAIKTRKKIPEV